MAGVFASARANAMQRNRWPIARAYPISDLLRQHSRSRKNHFGERALIDPAGYSEVRVICFRKRLGDWQAQPGSTGVPARRDLAERLKRNLQFLFAHARSGVADAQQDRKSTRLN